MSTGLTFGQYLTQGAYASTSDTLADRLARLYQEDWEWEVLDNPEYATQAGAHDTLWSQSQALQDVSPRGYRRRIIHFSIILSKLKRLLSLYNVDTLSPQEKTKLNLFRLQHEELIAASEKAPLYLIPANAIGGTGVCLSFVESIEWMRFENARDYQVLVQRMNAFPVQIDQFIAAMREGIRIGFVASKAQMTNVENTLKRYIENDIAEFKEPLSLLDQPSFAHLTHFKEQITKAINVVKAGYLKLLRFIENEYNATLRETPGVLALPDGNEVYALCLKFHTSTNLTAEEIHQIGLQEVAKIEQRYVTDVLTPLGYKSDEMEKFVKDVQSNPDNFAKTEEELVNIYKEETKRISDILPSFFKEFPTTRLEIVPNFGGPAAYYLAGTPDGKRPGRFYVNVSNLSGKPVYEKVALTVHEAVPGHHHQTSLANENTTLPNVLRFIEDRRYEVCPVRRPLHTAYGEGWGLYCEYLGEEMKAYDTPLKAFGRHSMDMMRAVRLVVDTGIHAQGWSVDKAVAYMMEKTGMQKHEVTKEILRYSTWPGQACAYKIGQLEIIRLRKQAEEALGPKFDIKEFHSLCLNSGSIPLTVLGELVQDYITSKK